MDGQRPALYIVTRYKRRIVPSNTCIGKQMTSLQCCLGHLFTNKNLLAKPRNFFPAHQLEDDEAKQTAFEKSLQNTR